jgi:hypothetical protein
VAITVTSSGLDVTDLEPDPIPEPPPDDEPIEPEVPEVIPPELVELDPKLVEEEPESRSDPSPILLNQSVPFGFDTNVYLNDGQESVSDSSSLRRDSEALGFQLSTRQQAARDLAGFDTPTMQEALDRLRRELAFDALRLNREAEVVVSAVEGISLLASAGLLAMLLQRGTLMAMALSAVPLWRRVDPLVVLALSDEEREKREEELRKAEAEEDESSAEVGRILGGREVSESRVPRSG